MMEDIPNQEMERRLAEHFAEESQRLRAPAGIWSSIRSRLAADSEPERVGHGGDCFHCGNGALYMLLPPLWSFCWQGTIWAVNIELFQGSAEEDACLRLWTLLSSPIATNSAESGSHLAYKASEGSSMALEDSQTMLMDPDQPCLRRSLSSPQLCSGSLPP